MAQMEARMKLMKLMESNGVSVFRTFIGPICQVSLTSSLSLSLSLSLFLILSHHLHTPIHQYSLFSIKENKREREREREMDREMDG